MALIRLVYEKGETSYLRLLTAQRGQSEARVRYINSVREWWAAKIELDGLLLIGGLQKPAE